MLTKSLLRSLFYVNQSYIFIMTVAMTKTKQNNSRIKTDKLEIRDSQNLAKLRHGCTTKLSDGGGEGIEFCFNWQCGWVATMVPNWELRSTFWFPFASM